MAVTIVATVGAATANSYVDVAACTAYMAGRLNADAWTDADDPTAALVEACRELQTLPWAGARADGTQCLAWPRQWVIDPDTPVWDPAADYPYYADDVIPQRVKDAQCEWALEFLKAGAVDLAKPDPTALVTRKKVDVLETQYEVPAAANLQGLARFPRIAALIGPLLDASADGGLDVVRV